MLRKTNNPHKGLHKHPLCTNNVHANYKLLFFCSLKQNHCALLAQFGLLYTLESNKNGFWVRKTATWGIGSLLSNANGHPDQAPGGH